MRPHLHLLLVVLSSGISAAAAEDAARGYLFMPVTTELQRRELVAPGTTVYAALNGAALLQGSTIDTSGLDLAAFRRELTALARERPGGVSIHLFLATRQAERPAVEFADAALATIGRRAGFDAAQVVTTSSSSDWRWQQQLDMYPAANDGGRPEGDEPLLHDQRVRVYPVCTRLSRWLTSNSDAVVVVRQPLDGRTPGLPAETVESIRRLVGQLQISDKHKLLFCVDRTKAGAVPLDRFVERGSKELAQSLGFAASSVRSSPNSGAPESLLGKPAPDFTLRGLDGKDLNLHEAIQGKVALVTFWGVACGPCLQEAPHLTKLYEQHRHQGFTVIAVNAYDETLEKVAKYVEQAKLTHPIVLMGRKVAREQFAVGAYPTSYWIDHHGKIVEYTVDFHPGDEVLLAAKLRMLLNQRGDP